MLRGYREFYEGEVREVHKNEAHSLIDAGYAKLIISEPQIQEEIRKEHKVEKIEKPKEEIKEIEEKFICYKCGFEAKSKAGLSRHKNVHKKKTKDMIAGRRVRRYRTK